MQGEAPSINRLANINDLRSMAKHLNLRLPAIMSSKQFQTDGKLNPNEPFVALTKQDEQLTDHEYEQPRPTTQQQYNDLWRSAAAISNTDLPEESQAIMKLAQPILTLLEQEYTTSKAEQQRLEHSLQELYLSNHELYEQLKVLRSSQFTIDAKRKIMLKELKQRHKNLLSSELYNLLPDQKEYKELLSQIDVLKQRITSLNSSTNETSQQLHNTKKQAKRSYIGLVRYLREALKHGLDYRQHGLAWIISKLHDLGVEATSKDLPSCLDEQSKKYLLAKNKKQPSGGTGSLLHLASERSIEGFESRRPAIRDKPSTLPMITPGNFNSQRTNTTTKSLSFIGVGDTESMEQRRMRRVYFNTKRCIDEIIKDRQTSLNAKVHQYSVASRSIEKLDSSNDRNFSQYQRIVANYPRSTYQLALKMLFGWDRSFLR